MLWPLLELLCRFVGVAEVQGLDEVGVVRLTIWTGHRMTVVAEEVKALVWMQKEFAAAVALLKTKIHDFNV